MIVRKTGEKLLPNNRKKNGHKNNNRNKGITQKTVIYIK